MRTKPALQRDLRGAAVLHVRSGRAVSRSSLAVALGVAPSTVGLYVDQLISEGWMDELGSERGRVGRPKRMLTTAASAGWFAGVEFNAERVQAVRVDFSGKLVAAEFKRPAGDSDARGVLRCIKAAVETLVRNTREPLLAVGVGAPGIVDPATGVSASYPFIPDWDRVPIADALRERFKVPVIVENNLRAIALAERWFGGGKGIDNYAILGPRSGFGIALVQGGRLLGGEHHAAGEVGRWIWPRADGRMGELQDALSAPAVWRRLTGADAHAPLPADLRAAFGALAGAKGRIWDEITADYARAIGCVQLLVDTEVFFLHGPLTALGPRFCHAIEQAARAAFPALAGEPLKIVPSALGDDAGALGAASLAMEAWVPTAG